MLSLLRGLARLPLSVMHAMGAWLGWGAYAASPSYRRRLRENVAAAGFDARVRRASIAHAGRMVAELPYLWLRARDEVLAARLHFADDEAARIDAALAARRGLVLMTPHIGAFEVCAQAYAERFGAAHPMTAMYRPARQAWLREMQLVARDRPGLLTAPASLAGIRQMLKALRRGDTVGLLPDQVPPEGMGVWAPYFGREAYTMTLAARLVQQTGCAVLLMVCERLPRGRGFAVHVRALPEPLWDEPPRSPPDEGDESDEEQPLRTVPRPRAPAASSPRAGPSERPGGGPRVHARDDAAQAAYQRDGATAINRAMEALVREQPGQYLWGYHRYKQPRRLAAASGVVEAA
jgi:KDO2-lipid IV(A) lauroyltransferase